MSERAQVGPVLEAGATALAVIAAIRKHHPDASIQDRGSYLRVSVPGRCVLRRSDVEHELGRPFALPGDLEQVMPAFSGRMHLDQDEASWE